MLCAVGDLLTDIVVQLDADPKRGTDTPARVRHVRGGSAATVALSAKLSGYESRFVGQVGDDSRGRELVDELSAAGVDVHVRFEGLTGTIVVLVDSAGERSFLTDRGAAAELAVVDVGVLEDVTWLHLPAYSFANTPLADVCHRLAGEAVDRRIPMSVSTSSVTALVEYGRAEFLELISTLAPEVVIANRPEAHHVLGDDTTFPATTWTVVTNGDRPTLITHETGEQRSVRPDPVDAVDTTGAGDFFTGSFLSSMARGVDPITAIRNGHEMAARSVRATGARLEDVP